MTACRWQKKSEQSTNFEIGQLPLARGRQIWHLGRAIFRQYRQRIH
jgi:hypothetical protein